MATELSAACVLNLRFMQWADERVLDAISNVPRVQALAERGSSFGGIVGTLQHIYRSERAWLVRLTSDPAVQAASIECPAEIDALRTAWSGLHREWIAWAEAVDDWDAVQSARTQQGGEYRLPRWQIILHVINHASYHRGQITTMMRQANQTPVMTDLIAFYREQSALTRSQASQS